MKKLLLFLLLSSSGLAQINNPPIVLVTTDPSGACAPGFPDQQVFTSGLIFTCQSGTWAQVGGGGGGGGTVTSVVDASGLFNVANPTTVPTFTFIAKPANTFLAGPTSGASASPFFRALSVADLPPTTLAASGTPIANTIAKWVTSNTLSNSDLTDDGTTLRYSGTGGIFSGGSPVPVANSVVQELIVDSFPLAGCTANGVTTDTQLNCAFETALAIKAASSAACTSNLSGCIGVRLKLGAHRYAVDQQLLEPVPVQTNEPLIDIVGLNHDSTWLVGTGTNTLTGVPLLAFQDASATFQYGIVHLEGFTVEPSGITTGATGAALYVAISKSFIEDVYYKSDVAAGSTAVVQIGDPASALGGTFEMKIVSSSIDSPNYTTHAFSAVTNTGGVPQTVTTMDSVGSGYGTGGAQAITGYLVNSLSGVACTTLGTITPTVTTGTITGASFSGFSGCGTGSLEVNFEDTNNVQFGWLIDDMTDSKMDDIVIAAGKTCQMSLHNHTSNNYLIGVHPEGGSLPCGIKDDIGGNHFISPEMDTIGYTAFNMSMANARADTVEGARWFWNSTEPFAEAYFVPTTTAPFFWANDVCVGTNPNGYHQLVTSVGPVPFYTGETGTATIPANVLSGPTISCDGTNVGRALTAATVSLGAQGATQFLTQSFSNNRGYVFFDNTGTQPFGIGAGSGHNLMFKDGVTPTTTTYVGGFDTAGNFGVGNNVAPGSAPFHVNGATAQVFQTACTSTASPAVCGSATTGIVQMSGTTLTINSTAITANTGCWFTPDSEGLTAPVAIGVPIISGRTAGTSITITLLTTPATPINYKFGCIN
jgi:hypothetical protein